MANVLPESMPQWSHIKEDVLWKKYNHRGTRLIGSEKEIPIWTEDRVKIVETFTHSITSSKETETEEAAGKEDSILNGAPVVFALMNGRQSARTMTRL